MLLRYNNEITRESTGFVSSTPSCSIPGVCKEWGYGWSKPSYHSARSPVNVLVCCTGLAAYPQVPGKCIQHSVRAIKSIRV